MPGFSLPRTNADAEFAMLRMSHQCVRVPDYDAAKAWFVDKLDFRVVHEWPEPMLGARLGYLAAANDDRCVIEVVGDGPTTAARAGGGDLIKSFGQAGFHHFCFTVPDVAAAIEKLRARDVTIAAEPFVVEAIGRKVAFFSDPFGNLFELEEVLA